MIAIIATLQAAPGKEDQLRAALVEMVSNVKTNEGDGVPAYELHTVNDEPGKFVFYERYATADAAAAHGKTDHMKALGERITKEGLLDGRMAIQRLTHIAGVS